MKTILAQTKKFGIRNVIVMKLYEHWMITHQKCSKTDSCFNLDSRSICSGAPGNVQG